MKNFHQQNNIGTVIVLAFFAVALAFAFIASLNKSEVVACKQLEAQAAEFKHNGFFYVTQWQVDMCKTHGIHFNVPVKNY